MSPSIFTTPSAPTSGQQQIRDILARHALFTVGLIGGPGNGKTELLAHTARRLRGELSMAAIIANPTAARDADRLKNACMVHSVITPDLTCEQLRQTLESMELANLDLLMIEHAAPDRPGSVQALGQDAIVTLFSVTDGDDKAAEFPHHLAQCDLVLLSKADLLPHVRFNVDVFLRDVRKANPYVRVMEISAVGEAGMEPWLQWLRCHVEERRGSRPVDAEDSRSEWFYG